MRYVLIVAAIFLILYPIYSIIKCLQVFQTLTNYGKGVLTGSLLLMAIGFILLIISIRLFKKSRN